MSETMIMGIQLVLYGLGTVFAALVGFALLVMVLRRTMSPPGAETAPADEQS